MYYLIYTSFSQYEWTNETLIDLLRISMKNNKEREITGMLVFLNNRFIQILEGGEEPVKEIYNRIVNDDRHERVTLVLEGYYKERLFQDWTMGFKKISDKDFEDISGYKDLDDYFRKGHIDDQSHPALIFMRHFYDKNYRDFKVQIRFPSGI